jgi:ferredoxin
VIANYGYQDGSGEYFISIDTARCGRCQEHWCLGACPERMFAIELDDYDDEVALVVPSARRRLKELCAVCKPARGWETLPCRAACRLGAIGHTW